MSKPSAGEHDQVCRGRPGVISQGGAGLGVWEANELLAPTLTRSQVLSMLHEAVHDEELTVEEAQERLDRAFKYEMRLWVDAVLRKWPGS